MKSKGLRIVYTLLGVAVCIVLLCISLIFISVSFEDIADFSIDIRGLVAGILIALYSIIVFLRLNSKGWYNKLIGDILIVIVALIYIGFIVSYLIWLDVITYAAWLFLVTAGITPLLLLIYAIYQISTTMKNRKRRCI